MVIRRRLLRASLRTTTRRSTAALPQLIKPFLRLREAICYNMRQSLLAQSNMIA